MPRLLTRERVAVALFITIVAGVLSFRPVYEPDLWWHLAQGRETFAAGIVRSNTFSFLYPDYRQHFTSWLFDVGAYLLWQHGGGAAVQVAQAALLLLTLALVYAGCRLNGSAAASTALLIVGAVVIEPRAIPRPFLVSFAGMAAVALLIARAGAARTARPLRWAVPVVLVWSNVHVESVFGVALLAVFAVSEIIRPATLPRNQAVRALAVAAICGCALFATPYGVGIARYFVENVSLPQILAIVEVQPPPLPAYRAFYAYVVIMAAVLLIDVRRIRLWELLAAILFAALGLRYLRLTPLVVLVTAPMVAARLTVFAARGVSAPAILVTSVTGAVLLARVPVTVLASTLQVGPAALTPPEFFSDAAIAYVRGHGLRGPMFNSNNLGGYLAWTLYPDAQVFQDGRLQAYPPVHFAVILRAARTQSEWDELVGGLQWAVLSVPRPNTLSGAGRFPRSEWATVFRDRAMEIVVRRGGAYARLVAE